jgi:hypothetical protein
MLWLFKMEVICRSVLSPSYSGSVKLLLRTSKNGMEM